MEFAIFNMPTIGILYIVTTAMPLQKQIRRYLQVSNMYLCMLYTCIYYYMFLPAFGEHFKSHCCFQWTVHDGNMMMSRLLPIRTHIHTSLLVSSLTQGTNSSMEKSCVGKTNVHDDVLMYLLE